MIRNAENKTEKTNQQQAKAKKRFGSGKRQLPDSIVCSGEVCDLNQFEWLCVCAKRVCVCV